MPWGSENMAQMLARGGLLQGQAIGSPVDRFGQGIGSVLEKSIGDGIQGARQERSGEEIKKLIEQYKDDPETLNRLSAEYKARGKDTESAALKQAADAVIAKQGRDQKAALTQAGQVATAARQEAIATRAEALGLPEIARTARATTDSTSLDQLAKDLRSKELKQVPTQSPQVRRSLANAAGISNQQFGQLKMATLSDEEFNAYIEGQKGDVEPWITESGDIKTLRVNDYGMVYDEEKGQWVQPGQAGLKQAPPQVQKVEQLASGMADELSKVGAKSFAELSNQAAKAKETLVSINKSLPKIDNMFTGTAANIRLEVAKAAKLIGIDVADPETVVNTETYVADSAVRVADYITNLGAGTGLSDKDREFAEKVVGGSIKADAETLRRLLKSIKEGANRTIDTYLKTKGRLKKELGASSGVLAYFPEVTAPTEEDEKRNTVNWADLP